MYVISYHREENIDWEFIVSQWAYIFEIVLNKNDHDKGADHTNDCKAISFL